MLKALAKALMRLAPVVPDPTDPTLRERFNLREFIEGSEVDRARFMVAVAHSRYLSECEMHIHTLFGLSQGRLTSLLKGKTVMELGCFAGGSVVAHSEAYETGLMYGVDVDDRFITAARFYTEGKGGRFRFLLGTGEMIPLPDESCDAIITQDTIEHVNDVSATVRECRRVLKPSGLLFCVFPGLYHPWGNHLSMVTKVPWLHLFFSDRVIEDAYREIIDERGEAAYWYRPGNSMEMHRRRFYEVNGITVSGFRHICEQHEFPIVYKKVAPLFSVGRRIQRQPLLRLLALPLKPLAALPVLEEILLHRVCYILQKPPVTWSSLT
jgi:SAM-dependent methyltransferase